MPRLRGQVTTISASSAKTTSSTSDTQNLGGVDSAVFILNVSASSSHDLGHLASKLARPRNELG